MPPRILSSVVVVASVTSLLLISSSAVSTAQDDMGEAIDHARSLSRAFRNAAEETMPSVVTLIAKTKPRFNRSREELRELLDDPRFRRMFPGGELPMGDTATALRSVAADESVETEVAAQAQEIVASADNYGMRWGFRWTSAGAVLLVLVFGGLYFNYKAKGGYKAESIATD